jgi:hypothetical protein
MSAPTAQPAQLAPSDPPVLRAAPQALQALPERLVQLEPLALAQAALQALQAFKGLLGSQGHLVQQAFKAQQA